MNIPRDKGGRIKQKLLQCKGMFFKGDPHPNVKGLVFNHYNHQRQQQFWSLADKLLLSKKYDLPTNIPKKFLGARNALNQDALQVSGEFTMRDPHPKVKGVVFLAKSSRGKQRWGWANKVSSKPKRKAPEGIPSKFIHQSGVSKNKLNQEVLQINGNFKKRDPHPKCPLIVFESYKTSKQRWTTLEKSLEQLKAKRRCNMTPEQIAHIREREIKRRSDVKYRNENRVRVAKWQKENPKKVARSRKNRYQKVKDDKEFKMKRGLRNSMRNIKPGFKNSATEEMLACTIEHCCNHLESQFTEGMTWDNMGKGGWHIDHIIPCAFFDLSKPSHQKVCFNWQNLQPLWESDNCAKGDKIPWYVLLTILMNNYKTITL